MEKKDRHAKEARAGEEDGAPLSIDERRPQGRPRQGPRPGPRRSALPGGARAKPAKRGRKRTRQSVERRLDEVEKSLVEAGPVDRLHLIQERLDLQAELAAMDGSGVDVAELEDEFVQAAAEYGSRRGLSYAAWRAAGVPPAVLRRAGIARS